MTTRSDEELALAYELEQGFAPRSLPEDHPERWQWEYRGSREEREGLLERLLQERCTCGEPCRCGVRAPEQDALPGL